MKQSDLANPKANHRPFPFGAGLEKSLSAYAAAAAAAGVSLLALKSPAEAKIVYTPANINILNGKPVPLDLNHDGVTDFLFSNVLWEGSASFLQGVRAGASNPGNAVWGKGVFTGKSWVSYNRLCSSGFAAALPAGFNVRPNNSYLQKSGCWVMGWRGGSARFTVRTSSYGQWMYTQNRYLGLKFMIEGEAHYGWARFSVTVQQGAVQATLTGYAYETIANTPIIAGKTKGPDVVTLEAATLGRLAQGASGMSAWQEKK